MKAANVDLDKLQLNKTEEFVYEIPKQGDMLVPGRIYGNENIINHLKDDVKEGKDWNAMSQIVNVAALPGIQKASLAMADVHPGYGFPIGGVGAFNLKEGVISVAGVGFDVSCGVHTMATTLTKEDVLKKHKELADALFKEIPAGLGIGGKITLTPAEVDELMTKGAKFAIARGFGNTQDLEYIENNGTAEGADPNAVSDKAKQREGKQLGTLGSGNHYLEVQYVDKIYNEKAAQAYGLKMNQVVVSIHCGSRAGGHQIGTDYLDILEKASKKYDIPIRDKELVCAPIESEEGKQYYAAVSAGANIALANRQVIGHLTRETVSKVMDISDKDITTFYDISHNTARLEEHDGEKLLVHRKGATRAFGPGREEIPVKYRNIGQPVLVGGTMGTCSFILHGTQKGMDETFGSAMHGAGRRMSRVQAKQQFRGDKLIGQLGQQGIIIKAHSNAGVAEEAPGAYKDVNEVIDVMVNAGIVGNVVRLKPLISVKG
ncbi:RNA-splicing ligase RtcB [archaeon]|nr:RNA-splicing ligase RtcB [archaeon]